MAVDFIGTIVTRASTPQKVYIVYNHQSVDDKEEDYSEFEEWVQM